jgi:hypothetical protein
MQALWKGVPPRRKGFEPCPIRSFFAPRASEGQTACCLDFLERLARGQRGDKPVEEKQSLVDRLQHRNLEVRGKQCCLGPIARTEYPERGMPFFRDDHPAFDDRTVPPVSTNADSNTALSLEKRAPFSTISLISFGCSQMGSREAARSRSGIAAADSANFSRSVACPDVSGRGRSKKVHTRPARDCFR